MLYLNQLDHPDMPYLHGTSLPDGPVHGNVAKSGCGLCCACMMVDRLTAKKLPLEEAVKLSEENGCNVIRGTRMIYMGPILAEKYNLTFAATGSTEEMLACLRRGGCAIINVSGDHDDHKGVFAKGGHYIIAIAWDGEELCILDPSWREEKFKQEHALGKVREAYPFLYCTVGVIEADTKNRQTPYYLFERKMPTAGE